MNSAIYALFQFYILHFTNQITLKQCLAQKLNLIFKFSSREREKERERERKRERETEREIERGRERQRQRDKAPIGS